MSAFDDLTLGEVEELSNVVLGGKAISDDASDPLWIAGGVMWLTSRRMEPSLTWDQFKQTTKMSEIKSFATSLQEAAELDPTNARNENPT